MKELINKFVVERMDSTNSFEERQGVIKFLEEHIWALQQELNRKTVVEELKYRYNEMRAGELSSETLESNTQEDFSFSDNLTETNLKELVALYESYMETSDTRADLEYDAAMFAFEEAGLKSN